MEHLPQVVWPLASAALAIAAIATAVVQLLKDLLPIRRKFQRRFLTLWFSERLLARKTITHQQLLAAEDDLIHLSTGGDKSAFYDLEPPQLCGQMNSAAQMAIAYPDRHPALFRFLAPEADETDIQSIVQHAQLTPEQKKSASVDPILDARNRVTHHLQRSIDALQIAMTFRWKFCLQIGIYIICFGLAFLSLFAVKRGQYTVAEAIAVAVVAGFLSPVISDFAAAINRWRRP
jgi:cytochrome bd-type quinol oxidase subunit 1